MRWFLRHHLKCVTDWGSFAFLLSQPISALQILASNGEGQWVQYLPQSLVRNYSFWLVACSRQLSTVSSSHLRIRREKRGSVLSILFDLLTNKDSSHLKSRFWSDWELISLWTRLCTIWEIFWTHGNKRLTKAIWIPYWSVTGNTRTRKV